MSVQYTPYTSHIQSVRHPICPHVVSKPYLLPTFHENITSLSITSQNSTSSAHVQSEYQPCCSCPISTPSPALILSEYHLYGPSPVQPVHDLSNPCLVSTLLVSLLPMYSNFTVSTTHVKTVHHLFCPCPVSTPSYLVMSSDYHLSCQCPCIAPSLLLISSLPKYIT